MTVLEYKIKGMNCSHCELHLKNALEQVEGVEKVIVSHSDSSVKIFGDHLPSLARLKEAVSEAGSYQIID